MLKPLYQHLIAIINTLQYGVKGECCCEKELIIVLPLCDDLTFSWRLAGFRFINTKIVLLDKWYSFH